MNYTPTEIASHLQGQWLQSPPALSVGYLTYDSRNVFFPSSSVFFALAGERRNGHRFLPELFQKGVRFFIVSETVDPELYPGAGILQVADTLEALQTLARHHRSRFDIPVIGIAGSNGKTIVKEWLFQLLTDHLRVARSPRSYNSQIGVPISLWSLEPGHQLGIFEAGISQPGEMRKLERMIQPTIGLLTNIGDAHDAGFKDRKEKLIEKCQLFSHCQSVIYEMELPGRFGLEPADIFPSSASLVSWSLQNPMASVFVSSISKTAVETRLELNYRGNTLSLQAPFTDDASIENIIHCVVTMLTLGFDGELISKGVKKLLPVNMRLERKKGIHHCTIINDSYSADLHSLHIALQFLKQQQAGQKGTVILSDLQQTGMDLPGLYEQVASEIMQAGVSRVVAIGPDITSYLSLPDSIIVERFPDTGAFTRQFRFAQFREEIILVKGARAFRFEEIVQLLEAKSHETVLEINLNALVQNLKTYQKLLKPHVRTMVMVKALAYGSGGAEVANLLQFHKVDYLGVAYVDEGVELRQAGVSLPVMVLNAEEGSYEALVAHGLEPVLYSPGSMMAFDQYLKEQGLTNYPVHVELETGMNRLGFSKEELVLLQELISGGASFHIQSVFSHLAASEDPAMDDFTNQQAKRFEEMYQLLVSHSEGGASLQAQRETPIRHISNSSAIVRHPNLQYDMVRLGIGLYGVPGPAETGLELQPVATLRSTIAQLKSLKTGDTVSYNRRGVVHRNSLIATVRIGYADGYSRKLGHGVGKVLIKGRLAPTIGTVCMDMIMVDVTDIPGVKEGDEVVIFGQELPIQQVAAWAGTIPYEVMTGISGRVKRVYFEE